MSEKRHLPTVLESNNFTIKYLFFSKTVFKKLNYIKNMFISKTKPAKKRSHTL